MSINFIWIESLFGLVNVTKTTFEILHAIKIFHIWRIWEFLLLVTDKNRQTRSKVFPTTELTEHFPPNVPTIMHQTLMRTPALTPLHRSLPEYPRCFLTHAHSSLLFLSKKILPSHVTRHPLVKNGRLWHESPLLSEEFLVELARFVSCDLLLRFIPFRRSLILRRRSRRSPFFFSLDAIQRWMFVSDLGSMQIWTGGISLLSVQTDVSVFNCKMLVTVPAVGSSRILCTSRSLAPTQPFLTVHWDF